ncbi:MAG: metallophosphoesterase, partial [Flavobacteriaceae bacterium]|nr:metallophosphoesterase [Flavobacteriaceae bacterium]
MQHVSKIFVIISTLFITSCATFYKQTKTGVNQNLNKTNSELSHTFYLIGDAGNADLGGSTPALSSLQKRLESANENSTVIFLGDNIYPHGLPKKDESTYELAKHRLQTQIDAVKDFKGNTIFIPGNHDWHSNGIKGLKRQEKYVEDQLGKKTFLPED